MLIGSAPALKSFGLSAPETTPTKFRPHPRRDRVAYHANRFWVSGHGTDSGACGPVSAPCLSFQRAHDNAAAGDEIDVLDPADYGTVVITKAISIINDGVGTAGVQVGSGNAVTINAGPGDAVHLRGLDIDGLGTADNGIVFNSGAGLAVVNCVVRHFHFNGSFTMATAS